MIGSFIAVGVILSLIVLGLLLFGIWIAVLGLGALFGTWFVSGGTLEQTKAVSKDDMADVFAGRDDRPK